MWENKYIQIVIISLIGVVYQLFNLETIIEIIGENFYNNIFGGIITIIATLIPLSVLSIVSYKGLFEFWRDLKNKKNN